MSIDDQQCNDCGASDWNKVLSTDYPERRHERDRTEKQVYVCNECGAEGRLFEHKNAGTTQVSGALR